MSRVEKLRGDIIKLESRNKLMHGYLEEADRLIHESENEVKLRENMAKELDTLTKLIIEKNQNIKSLENEKQNMKIEFDKYNQKLIYEKLVLQVTLQVF